MPETKILIVDDEPDLVALVAYHLRKEGFGAVSVSSGEEALETVRQGGIDLVLLDLMLPGIQGTEVCRMLREDPRTEAIPVIMLTARADVSDRVRGLESGADDYLPKPFSPTELLARVKAVLRRTAPGQGTGPVIVLGDLRIDQESYQVTKRKVPLHLSATEFKLLLFLAERKGRVFSRDQLLDAVWKGEAFVEPRTVDVHISRLRTQLEDDPAHPVYLKTRRGVGYYLEGEW